MANRKQALFASGGVVCATAEDTARLGGEVAAELSHGSVISLEGPLGAGKTQFSRGFAAALGCDAEVSSPSFAILHEYAGGRVTVFHFDFYRLDSASELATIGYDDCLAMGVSLIEWGDKFPEALPPGTLRLRFEILPDGGRRIRAVSADAPDDERPDVRP